MEASKRSKQDLQKQKTSGETPTEGSNSPSRKMDKTAGLPMIATLGRGVRQMVDRKRAVPKYVSESPQWQKYHAMRQHIDQIQQQTFNF